MTTLKKDMVRVDWTKVGNSGGAYGRCSDPCCFNVADYMRKSRNRYGEYYRVYCKYCATSR